MAENKKKIIKIKSKTVFSEQQEFPFNLCSLGLMRRGGACGQQHGIVLDADEQKKKAADAHSSTLPNGRAGGCSLFRLSEKKKNNPPAVFLIKPSVVTLLSTSGT